MLHKSIRSGDFELNQSREKVNYLFEWLKLFVQCIKLFNVTINVQDVI